MAVDRGHWEHLGFLYDREVDKVKIERDNQRQISTDYLPTKGKSINLN